MACQPCVIFILGQISMTEKYCLSGLVGTVTVLSTVFSVHLEMLKESASLA